MCKFNAPSQKYMVTWLFQRWGVAGGGGGGGGGAGVGVKKNMI